MPTYLHRCNECEHEWEDFYSITQDPPTQCPSCNFDGKVQRLIYGGSGRGIVELKGRELISKLIDDGKKLKKEAVRNENVLANLVGEDRYHNNLLNESKRRRRGR